MYEFNYLFKISILNILYCKPYDNNMKDKTHPSAVSLDGFISKYLKPVDFRDLLKNTFSIILSPKELGSLKKKKFFIHYIHKYTSI